MRAASSSVAPTVKKRELDATAAERYVSSVTAAARTLISAQRLKSLLAEDPLVVDCRFSLADPGAGRRGYEEGHVPGAVYAHLDDDLSGPIEPGRTGRHPLPDPARLAETLASWGMRPGRQVIVYDDKGGAIAARLWWMLRWLGHDAVAVLDGGYRAWLKAGGTASREVPAPERGAFEPKLQSALAASVDEVDALRQSADARVLDAREAVRYRGEQEPIDPVAGRIPGARSLPYTELLDEADCVRTATQLFQLYEEAIGGVPPARVAVYCGSGVTACLAVLAAEHAGLRGVRLYAGSWSEWITDPSRPVARGAD
jgi:thiosulfate/3-mercaptopyruvate sulfurtransferase